jgi:hypothetical protein
MAPSGQLACVDVTLCVMITEHIGGTGIGMLNPTAIIQMRPCR